MNLKINKTTIALFLFYLMGVFIVAIGPSVIPDYYYADSKTIKILIDTGAQGSILFSSYYNTAFFYKSIGLGSQPIFLVGLFGYTLAFGVTVFLLKKIKWRWHPIPILFLGAWNILLAVYYGMYSKEPLAFFIVATPLFLAGSRKALFLGGSIILLYGLFFRPYWILVLGFCSILFLLITYRYKISVAISLILIIAMGISQIVFSYSDLYLSDFREELNFTREFKENSKTEIGNIIHNDSPLTDISNSLINWFRLNIPFYLLMVSVFKYLPFIFFQLGNVFLFIYVANNLIRRRNEIEDVLGIVAWRRVSISISWIISFSFVQGIFEPDFGSFARHQMVLLPMWMVLLATRFGLLKKYRWNTISPPLQNAFQTIAQ